MQPAPEPGNEPFGRGSPEVAVIGLGRVGLPLALAFADAGLNVVGVDNDPSRIAALRDGRMPFEEPGAQAVLDRVGDRLTLAEHAADVAVGDADHIVLTLGTPAMSHIEIDLRQIRAVLDDLLPQLRNGHAIHLRSTIAPNTTDFVAGYLAKHRGFTIGEEVFVAHVPERIASAKFFEEISTLPCIIGGVGERSGAVAAELFERLGAPIVQTTPVQAELAKIWTNILRYTTFALPNLMMMDCEQYDANVFEVIDLINRDYPRGGMRMPGFTAGTCLRKDFTFSEERSNAPGMLLAVSRVNESVPLFLVQGLKRRLGALGGRKIAVLGLAFKSDTDDERDSLSHKLIRMLERELADVAIHDPHVPTPTQPLGDAVLDADAVVIATNHPEFCTLDALRQIAAGAKREALIVDPWNCWGAAQVFAHTDEVLAMSSPRGSESLTRTRPEARSHGPGLSNR
jgi:UDP-N-acetyl-D-mannosaminuronic acid dehydrogenase